MAYDGHPHPSTTHTPRLKLSVRINRTRNRQVPDHAQLHHASYRATRTPTFSPARPSSSSLRNISTPVHVVFVRILDTNNLNLVTNLNNAALNYDPSQPFHDLKSRTHPQSASKRLVNRTLRLRNIRVQRLNQALNRRVHTNVSTFTFKAIQR